MGKGSDDEVKETADEVELKRVAIERWNDHQARLLPFENAYIRDVTRDPAAAKGRAAGQVNADLAQKVSGALPPPGVSPNSGRATAFNPAIGRALAKAQVDAGENIEDNRARGLQSVVDLGQGKAAQAMEGFGVAAANATKKAITDAQLSQQNRDAMGSAIMSVVGAGAAVGMNMRNAPAGNIKEFGPEAQRAAIAGADPYNPDGYSYNSRTGALTWNKKY